MNSVKLFGRLTKDFEISEHNKNGEIFCVAKNFVAVGRKWINKSGNKEEHTDFIPITLFGKSAQNAGQFFKKGSKFLCEGRINTESWQDDTGETKYSWGVIVSRFYFVDSKAESGIETNQASIPEPPKDLPNVVSEETIENANESEEGNMPF